MNKPQHYLAKNAESCRPETKELVDSSDPFSTAELAKFLPAEDRTLTLITIRIVVRYQS